MEKDLFLIVGRLQPEVVISQWCSGEGEDHANKTGLQTQSEVKNVTLKVLLG
jgi:hypothetical protein